MGIGFSLAGEWGTKKILKIGVVSSKYIYSGISQVLVGFWRMGHSRVCWSFEFSLESEERREVFIFIYIPSALFMSTHLGKLLVLDS